MKKPNLARTLTEPEIESLRKLQGSTRALRWAWIALPKSIGVKYTIAESDSISNPPKKGLIQILKMNRKEYWQFLEDNKMEPGLYETSLGNYHDWLVHRD